MLVQKSVVNLVHSTSKEGMFFEINLLIEWEAVFRINCSNLLIKKEVLESNSMYRIGIQKNTIYGEAKVKAFKKHKLQNI